MRSTRVDTINNDDRLGATVAVEHLVELGHRHIWHIDGGRGAGAAERRAGYESTMQRHGLEPHVVSAAFTEGSGAEAAQRALTRAARSRRLRRQRPECARRTRRDREAPGCGARRHLARRLRQHVRRRPSARRPDDGRPSPRAARQLAIEALIERIEQRPHRGRPPRDRPEPRDPRHDSPAAALIVRGSSRSTGSASARADPGTSTPWRPCRRADRPASSSA